MTNFSTTHGAISPIKNTAGALHHSPSTHPASVTVRIGGKLMEESILADTISLQHTVNVQNPLIDSEFSQADGAIPPFQNATGAPHYSLRRHTASGTVRIGGVMIEESLLADSISLQHVSNRHAIAHQLYNL